MTRLEALLYLRERQVQRLEFCSRDDRMDKPAEGWEKDWKEAKEALAVIDEMIAELAAAN